MWPAAWLLLWSADPSLRGDIDETERLLNYAAFDIASSLCDPPNPVSPNNVYGYGRLDVKAAVGGGIRRYHHLRS